LAFSAAGHALLNKDDSRSALGWIAVCLTFPLAGPVLYALFGVNRVHRSASRLRREIEPLSGPEKKTGPSPEHTAVITAMFGRSACRLERVGRNVLGVGLTAGNCIEPLFNGDQAYPRMVRAIREARKSIYLATYILNTDKVGRRFIDELQAAVGRGVEVRVLVDGIGEKYSWPPRASRMLKKKGVPTALFIPPRFFPPTLHINLRNHRKVLVVDGVVGFTGGMNISRGHLVGAEPPRPVTDLHFLVQGPIVSQLQDSFLDDWLFATKKNLVPPETLPEPAGDSLCRAVIDGPDVPHESLRTLLLGIISAASDSIRIMTPYFLPPQAMLSALKSAKHRGVDVCVILPERNNLPFVHWATLHILEDLILAGITIAFQPEPFCHTKLLLVDDSYVHLGSANLDNRSLRLNFELTLEVFDRLLSRDLTRHFDAVMNRSRLVTVDELRARPLPARMRDAAFWLFSPYL
jgi:cardiolipin synthase